ncbi:MAG TPA: ATP-dependent helicase HrpB [Nitrospirota bacterium]|nr:ATP-dependent helicase HrpB [Nitrospirota bacterium]
MTSYPIDNILPELKEAVLHRPSVILHAPPGAGKTTRVPLALLEVIPRNRGRIVMLEPRRIAAVSAARWMAVTLNEQTGETIGYAIRFDAKISEKTRVEVVTEGILTRRIQSDPGLNNTAMVIFDEFHERSIHADLALALCLDIRRELRPDLKILVMSATLDYGPLAAMLGAAPVITSSGKAYPVAERYLTEKAGPLPERIAWAIRTALKETEGDILVFLPGSAEIRACMKELDEAPDILENRVSVHALYGDLAFEEQERAIMPSRDHRKIVLATNIAETSLTIQGVRAVVDSGLTRMLRYDPATGMNRLVTVALSQASAEQRKGRAGRLGPGVCYRLYAPQELRSMSAFAKPEILVSDLAPLALELAAWGVKDTRMLSWIDVPPAASWDSGLQLLEDLGAVDSSGSITPVGRAMVRLPLHPRLSRLMTRAQELGCVRLGADLAAILTERDLFRQRTSYGKYDEQDVSERVEALWKWRAGEEPREGVDPTALRSIERTSKQLLRMRENLSDGAVPDRLDQDMVSRLLLCAFPDRICKRREEGGGRFVHSRGRGVRLSRESQLGSSPYIIAVAVDAGEKTEGFVHIAAPVTEELIRTECAGRIETARRVEWDRKENRIAAAREERLETLILSRKPFTPTDEEAAPIVCDAIRENCELLPFSGEARQFLARVRLIRSAYPEEEWPDLTEGKLFSGLEEWLLPWLGKTRSAHDIAVLDILPALRSRLSWEQARLLDERAPLTISVPSGSRIALDYSSGQQPVLAVKIQEMFGLADTPAVAGGRVKVLLHLLSPARRPVQITQDLKGFWNISYQEIKKVLKGRYPKHPWPEDPWNAVPTRKTKPQGA